ncbi:MAG TPA: hypothetical protein VLV88_00650 [Terriglobales bacterium]|nr:hypothetical protein [Terriglobales bacterium]
MRSSLVLLLAFGIPFPTATPSASARKLGPSPASAPTQSKAIPSAMNAMQPAAELQSLSIALAGDWSTQETYEPGELTPNGGQGSGHTSFRRGPGGFTLEEEYHSQTPAGELFGFGVIWWDATKGLQHLWCINVYPAGCEMFPGPPQPGPRWDGKSLVLHVESDQQGKRMVFHEVISDITPSSFTQTADIGEAGSPLKRWFTIHATRLSQSRHSPPPSKQVPQP